ncbi:hypothetical protein C2E21_2851 [Chlorella sorokiniana]|jgi:hypothetical protein|uniref:Uncharacterized protein n=1 Tax=Chlorella sorokiniana TaxID=3076 RepID=A0A2P6TW66_CHLSO|nr:hypothetical protein C2E21_2851 [Chlorella sorokiniana]|eukprot:PRW58305.1 hypothetical protein C2E21_2851 [Chlorella sorokiniana]
MGGFQLEAFKFAIYVALPIGLTAAVVLNQDMLQRIIKSRSYVTYPPSDVTDEKIQELLAKERARKF